ncbi:hypothetical protein CC80DRAFT_469878 [Byssothecium circinans]|uniref:Uncharacterized protein n=1 Tax=Byssothecium circinans TaxID=147558 RepID=A0A6A5U9Q5_9PLEO|nr:hypothetical protein CC80DRAFT_469878 [Byssothecium circinans]
MFKASFTAGVGTCFTQHLWHILRNSATSVSIIEEMFLLRSNVIALSNPRSIVRAPLLFLMALSIWWIGIATIYPPGALTVELEPYSPTSNLNISVMSPDPAKSFNPMLNISASQHPTLGTDSPPQSSLQNLGKVLVMTGEILDLPVYAGENSSYRIQFRAPQVLCNETTYNDIIEPKYVKHTKVDLPQTVTTGLYTSYPNNGSNATYGIKVQTQELSCRMYTKRHDVNVTYTRGQRQIELAANDIQPFSIPPQTISYSWLIASNERTGFHQVWCRFGERVARIAYMMNIADTHNLCYNLCENQNELLGSIFHTNRFNGSKAYADLYNDFDPRKDIHINQDILNSALTNLTISALSLGTWWQMTPVTTTRYAGTYRFSQPRNLIIPYSVCLGVAAIFSIIGLVSLYRNDVGATDGGFLQIMMATRGDTEMERLVVSRGANGKGETVATDDVSKELKELKIRYGELIIGDAMVGGAAGKRLGFGTVDETLSLRKRV